MNFLANISLKYKLILTYCAVMVFSVVTFVYWIYNDIEKGLVSKVDISLVNSARNIVDYFELYSDTQIKHFDNNSGSDSIDLLILQDKIIEQRRFFDMVYETLTLNPRRFFIQVINDNNDVIFQSTNLTDFVLPVIPSKEVLRELKTFSEPIFVFDTIPKYIYRYDTRGIAGDSILATIPFQNTNMRLFILKSNDLTVSVGFSLLGISAIMDNIKLYFIIGVPILLLILIGLLLFFTKLGNSPIEKLTNMISKLHPEDKKNDIPLVENIIEYRNLTNSINKLITRYEENIRRKYQFVSNASHELKTPLTILRGELEMALGSARSEEDFQSVLASSLDEVIRLSNVVDALLEISKAESGKIILKLERTNISKMINDLSQDIEILAEDKNLKLELNIDNNIYSRIDSARFYQALLNVIDNAIKYNKQNGMISIELKNIDGRVKVIVSDTGIGISPEDLERVFERFFRADDAKDRNIVGTGLGLPIVKWIVDSHNGSIIINSELNIGTSVEISIPGEENE